MISQGGSLAKKLAIVLSGGGARGALQVGAIQALIEAGIKPDLLVGTSIGAANAVTLGILGFNQEGLEALKSIYRESAEKKLLSDDYLQLMVRALVRRPASEPSRRIRDLYVKHGITPTLRFGDLEGPRVLVVATDLNHQARLIYGLKMTDLVLDALIASTAIPPWVPPIENNGMLLMDGAIVSNLPIEPALTLKPRRLIALDIQENREIPEDSKGFGPLFNKLVNTMQKRQLELEFALAAAARVQVQYIHLYAEKPVPVYAFERWEELIERGYAQAQAALTPTEPEPRSHWWSRPQKDAPG